MDKLPFPSLPFRPIGRQEDLQPLRLTEQLSQEKEITQRHRLYVKSCQPDL